jgi:hypothetical protein
MHSVEFLDDVNTVEGLVSEWAQHAATGPPDTHTVDELAMTFLKAHHAVDRMVASWLHYQPHAAAEVDDGPPPEPDDLPFMVVYALDAWMQARRSHGLPPYLVQADVVDTGNLPAGLPPVPVFHD